MLYYMYAYTYRIVFYILPWHAIMSLYTELHCIKKIAENCLSILYVFTRLQTKRGRRLQNHILTYKDGRRVERVTIVYR